jgi:hypothetical protein
MFITTWFDDPFFRVVSTINPLLVPLNVSECYVASLRGILSFAEFHLLKNDCPFLHRKKRKLQAFGKVRMVPNV